MADWSGRKKWVLVLAFSLIAGLLTACSGGKNEIPKSGIGVQAADDKQEELHIVCTTYPQYDWIQQILGENPGKIKVTYLLKSGVDIHSYQPSAEDMMAISDCDLLIYVGGQSEQWIEEAQKNRRNKNQKVINMMEVLGERIWEEELVEGMQAEEEHLDNHFEDKKMTYQGKNEHEEEEIEYDEHVWLSLKNAEQICREILNILEEIDPVHQEIYQKNGNCYLEKLDALDRKYQELMDIAEQKTILFADRFPFRYLTEEYGLDYFAAFAGCSAETEASFETIAFLAAKVDEWNLPVIYRIETSDDLIAKTVRDSTAQKNQQILVLDSLQAVTQKEIEEGYTYLSVMEQNLELLKQGLLKE